MFLCSNDNYKCKTLYRKYHWLTLNKICKTICFKTNLGLCDFTSIAGMTQPSVELLNLLFNLTEDYVTIENYMQTMAFTDALSYKSFFPLLSKIKRYQ